MNSHYRSPLDFSDAALYAAQSGYDKIKSAVIEVRKRKGSAPDGEVDKETAQMLQKLRGKFEAAMNDDLNTSVALSVLFELVRDTQKILEDSETTRQTLEAIDDTFRRLGGDVLGIVKDEYEQTESVDNELVDKLVNILIGQRNEARKQKDYARADELRDKIDEAGIALEDKPDGTTWRTK